MKGVDSLPHGLYDRLVEDGVAKLLGFLQDRRILSNG
jgi:hypothetical protein